MPSWINHPVLELLRSLHLSLSLSIHTRPQGKVEIIDLSGRLTLGDATAALRLEVRKVLDRKSDILVNLAVVSYIDSAGLGQLVEGYSKATAEGRTMKLLNPHKRVDSLLHHQTEHDIRNFRGRSHCGCKLRPIGDNTQMHPPQFQDETISLQQKLARVQGLLEASRRVHSTIKLDDVLETVLEIAAKELEADGAFFASNTADLEPRGNVFGKVPDNWSRWTEFAAIAGYASAPLPGERGETVGHLVIYRPEPLTLEEADFLEGLGLQSSLAIGNAQHHEKMIEWERVKLDLDTARNIQRSLLPQTAPNIEGYTIGVRSTTCYEVGGDYVDVIPIPDGRWMMVVADVAGKGFASALMGATFRSTFRAMAGTGLPLAQMATRMNMLHWQEGLEARRRYVTAILLCLDPVKHTIEFVNAGHNPAFLMTGTGETIRIGASGPPLGMLPGMSYEIEEHALDLNGQLLLYTDGLTEVFQGEEEFGEDRLLELLTHKRTEEFLDYTWRTLTQFAGGARQTDDMTALYICRAAEGKTA